ncbi:hypothetical protein HDU92_004260 [Lobulomyces angularis]|nr:hypothetical protein HDU92_004260 [Lobulomyces angularis]
MYMEDIDVNVTELEEVGNIRVIKSGVNLTEILIDSPAKAKKRNSSIDKILKMQVQKEKNSSTLKLLVLGSGDSGKSTFVRQLRLSYTVSFTSEELSFFKNIIYLNIFYSLKTLLNGLEKLKLNPNPSQEFYDNSLAIKQHFQSDEKTLPWDIIQLFPVIWNEEIIKECFARREELDEDIQDTMP